ncbi:extracellular solute-binding protein [Zavarzinia sp. CC-PAN008]|uniref:extracellular solute-binding protein n=1 Tax=Zavarzinia sp. CC-PAN008 TaxID=3243332 RepID=UPI003F744BB8
MGPMRAAALLVCAALVSLPAVAQETNPAVTRTHALSLLGEPKYPADFAHVEVVNPDAPKGGAIVIGAMSGGFDSLNPFIVRGNPAAGVGQVYETLMASPPDDPNAEYGLVAESVEFPADRSWVTFHLRAEARWHDGKPITAEDVVFSFETLRDKGAPFYRSYYANVTRAEILDARTVKFTFDQANNRELPQIMGQLVVLPRHWWADRKFEETSLEPPLGSGPYRVANVKPPSSITLERVPDYWAKDLPINRGQDNFDTIRYEYYRDPVIAFEGFKGRAFDFYQESRASNWATGYDFPAVKNGLVRREEPANGYPAGMQGFVLNTRRPQFADIRVRRALDLAYDFEWANKNLFFGAYSRTQSYFERSELASTGVPEGAELALLEPFRDRLPAELFTTPYRSPVSDGSGRDRTNLRQATQLLKEAGWTIQDRKLVNAEGQQMRIEFLLDNDGGAFERVILPYIQNLERLGIAASIRNIDSTQFENRQRDFDYDVVVATIGQSLSPGNEQRDFFSTKSADEKGSRNLAGVRDPVVDALIEKVIFAADRDGLLAATRALDRVLLWGHYVVPQWYLANNRIAWWDRFGRPEKTTPYSVGFPTTWWLDPARDAAIAAGRAPN